MKRYKVTDITCSTNYFNDEVFSSKEEAQKALSDYCMEHGLSDEEYEDFSIDEI